MWSNLLKKSNRLLHEMEFKPTLITAKCPGDCYSIKVKHLEQQTFTTIIHVVPAFIGSKYV